LKQVYDINGFVTVRRVVESRNHYCFVGDEDVLITMKSDGWELIEDSWEKYNGNQINLKNLKYDTEYNIYSHNNRTYCLPVLPMLTQKNKG
jgi:hypothetical protein